MSGKKSKAIRKLANVLLLDWLNRNLPEGSLRSGQLTNLKVILDLINYLDFYL